MDTNAGEELSALPADRGRGPSEATMTGEPVRMRWLWVFAVLSSLGMAIIYGLKVNLSVTIVAMVNHTQTHMNANAVVDAVEDTSHHEGHGDHGEIWNGTSHRVFDAEDNDKDNVTHHLHCVKPGGGGSSHEDSEDGPFAWSEVEQGLVLGSFFWGYLITQIPAGYLGDKAGGKWMFLSAVVLNVLGTILSPALSHLGYQYLILARFVEGLGSGVTFPAMNVLIARWAPDNKRAGITTLVFSGTAFGTVVSLLSSGLLAGTLGWASVFYVHGGLSIIWCVLWCVFVTDSPRDHTFISEREKEFILKSTKIQDKASSSNVVPWRQILTSVPFWALAASHTLINFGWYMLLVELPIFLRSGLGMNIKENAVLSAVPFLCNWLFSLAYSNRLDWARNKGLLSTIAARRLSVGLSSLLPAICLGGIILSGCDNTAVMAFVILATTFYGAMFAGVFSNHCDIASNYAGLLMGITNTFATIPGFVVPFFVAKLTEGGQGDHGGLGPWHIVFSVTAGLLVLECLVFFLFASGTEQPWNNKKAAATVDNDDEKVKEQEEDNKADDGRLPEVLLLDEKRTKNGTEE